MSNGVKCPLCCICITVFHCVVLCESCVFLLFCFLFAWPRVDVSVLLMELPLISQTTVTSASFHSIYFTNYKKSTIKKKIKIANSSFTYFFPVLSFMKSITSIINEMICVKKRSTRFWVILFPQSALVSFPW